MTNEQLERLALLAEECAVGPVVDYGAFTDQQTLANWQVKEGESAIFEFRGSSSAPTTSPESTVEAIPQCYDPISDIILSGSPCYSNYLRAMEREEG